MRHVHHFLMLLVAGLACASDSAAVGEGYRQLKAREITSKLTGQEFTDEVHFAQVFNRDGTLSVISMGTRKTGRWRVVGDELCLASEGDEPRCYLVWTSGKKMQLRQPGISITEDGVLQRPAAHN